MTNQRVRCEMPWRQTNQQGRRSSTIRVLVGKCTLGLFSCISDYEADCMLSHLEDTFYNRERLMAAMDNPVDGTVVAYA